ncbi:hypothetical protein PLESTB_001206600 [Pleodorina starrii]|uniref:Ubiquitin-like domain-containing protein n=1 Tax=Pleodorina starrii TaxID=330485 RepID=A0A9W6BRY8_9CHLO|nr:hypothetical protein PLESTM_001749900 [Pleodorina starrii]GLC57274.1 hypothetical protein PLESTB_001206600 [Pleodorina starrii]
MGRKVIAPAASCLRSLPMDPPLHVVLQLADAHGSRGWATWSLQRPQPPESQQLYKGQTVLEDARKLLDLKVENDDVLALCYLQPDGTFEPINISTFESEKPE